MTQGGKEKKGRRLHTCPFDFSILQGDGIRSRPAIAQIISIQSIVFRIVRCRPTTRGDFSARRFCPDNTFK